MIARYRAGNYTRLDIPASAAEAEARPTMQDDQGQALRRREQFAAWVAAYYRQRGEEMPDTLFWTVAAGRAEPPPSWCQQQPAEIVIRDMWAVLGLEPESGVARGGQAAAPQRYVAPAVTGAAGQAWMELGKPRQARPKTAAELRSEIERVKKESRRHFARKDAVAGKKAASQARALCDRLAELEEPGAAQAVPAIRRSGAAKMAQSYETI